MSTPQLINGLIGKEFLYDENLFISNYNPFVTANTSGIPGLYNDTTLTGKLYIFNKKEYKEPSKEEFQNIKSISELAAAPYRLINDASFNSLSITILSKYNEISKERTFQLIKENSILDINPILSNGLNINDFLYNPENNNLGTFAIFVIDHSTETGKLNKKTYTDLAAGEQFLMYLIPSELINVSESGTDSTKLISLTLSDASKQSISTNSFEVIPSTIPEESGLNYFYAESLLTIPGDTKYTRTNAFNSINIYFKVTSNTNFNFETNGFGLSEILKQKIFNNLKTSMLNDVKFSTFDINVLSLDKLIFSLNNNEIFVSLTLSNTENNTILPETPTLNLKLKDELNYIEETVNEFLNVELLNFKGTYLLPPVYHSLRYSDSNGIDGFFELQQLTQNNREGICFSTGDPDLDLPNRKVYLYGGATDNISAVNNNLTNTLLRSDIQNDGSLEGFTQIGTNSLNLFQAATYTYINDPVTGTGWVYIFGGLAGAATYASNKVKRAPILMDGTIGTWEDIYTFNNFRNQRIIGNPEDKRYFYVYSSLRTVSNKSYYDFINTIYTFRINEDGSISLIQTYTSTKNHYLNSSIILKDPVSNKQFLYIFGTKIEENDPSIYRYEIASENQDENLSYNIIGDVIKVGNLDNILMAANLIEDNENIYIVGGRSTSNYKIGARKTVLKYSKDLLIKGSPTNLINPEILPNIAIPISVSVDQITTKYGSYIICPITTTNETGTTYNWQSTNRVLGFKFNETNLEFASSKLILNEVGNYPDDSVENKIDIKTNFFPNKFGYRPIEELYTNLFVKGAQTLTAYGETIKFVNPENTDIGWEIEEMVKPIALPRFANIFLKWIEELSINTTLDNFNNYRYVNNAIDSEKIYSVLIPELIFNILGTAKLYNLNKSIFKNYLLTNPPSAELDPNGIITEQFIDEVLYAFYKCKVTSSNYVNLKSSLIYNANGLVVPDLTKINFSSKYFNYGFIFFPQRHNKYLENSKIFTPSFLSGTHTYLDNISGLQSSLVVPKDPNADGFVDGTNINDLIKFGSFDYYVSPTGSDTNSGRVAQSPRATLDGISNSRVLLLPGTYASTIINNENHQLFIGMGSGNSIYGCGNLTIIDRTGNTAGRDKPIIGGNPVKLSNLKVIYDADGRTTNYTCALFKGGNYSLLNINFQISGNYSLAYDGTSTYTNCTFVGGTLLPNYDYRNSATSILATEIISEFDSYFLNLTQEKVDNMIKIKNFSLIIETEYSTFTPMYTLLPLGDNVIDAEIISETDVEDKNIILDFTTNITDIKNLSVKL